MKTVLWHCKRRLESYYAVTYLYQRFRIFRYSVQFSILFNYPGVPCNIQSIMGDEQFLRNSRINENNEKVNVKTLIGSNIPISQY